VKKEREKQQKTHTLLVSSSGHLDECDYGIKRKTVKSVLCWLMYHYGLPQAWARGALAPWIYCKVFFGAANVV